MRYVNPKTHTPICGVCNKPFSVKVFTQTDTPYQVTCPTCHKRADLKHITCKRCGNPYFIILNRSGRNWFNTFLCSNLECNNYSSIYDDFSFIIKFKDKNIIYSIRDDNHFRIVSSHNSINKLSSNLLSKIFSTVLINSKILDHEEDNDLETMGVE